MRTRRCRYHKCRQPFTPEKDFYYYCSWDCRVADVGSEYQRDFRGYQHSGDQHYDRGFWAGTRAQPSGLEIPQGIWKGLVLFSHPDKWQGEPGLATLAHEVTLWLLAHRPDEARRH
jgi:hypothetical protein